MVISELYPLVKNAHVGLVLASGSLFAVRGITVLFGSTFGMCVAVRYLSYTIDTALFVAALLLLAILQLNPFVTPWLAAKIVLLLVYIALGSLALKRTRARPHRIAAFAGALLCFAMMFTIARRRDPLGFLGQFTWRALFDTGWPVGEQAF